jgi:hypothetical protein
LPPPQEQQQMQYENNYNQQQQAHDGEYNVDVFSTPAAQLTQQIPRVIEEHQSNEQQRRRSSLMDDVSSPEYDPNGRVHNWSKQPINSDDKVQQQQQPIQSPMYDEDTSVFYRMFICFCCLLFTFIISFLFLADHTRVYPNAEQQNSSKQQQPDNAGKMFTVGAPPGIFLSLNCT